MLNFVPIHPFVSFFFFFLGPCISRSHHLKAVFRRGAVAAPGPAARPLAAAASGVAAFVERALGRPRGAAGAAAVFPAAAEGVFRGVVAASTDA